jgi:hypothetical protein
MVFSLGAAAAEFMTKQRRSPQHLHGNRNAAWQEGRWTEQHFAFIRFPGQDQSTLPVGFARNQPDVVAPQGLHG